MKQFWFRLSTRLDALTLRERVMVFAALLASVVFGAYLLVLSPMYAQQETLAKTISAQQASIAQVETQLAATNTAAGFDPDAQNKARLAALQAEVDQLGGELRNMQESLVQPERIVPLLEAMLKSNGRLRLVSLRTLPVTGLSEPLPTGPETVAPPPPAPARLSYEAIAAEMAKSRAEPEPAPPPPAFKPPELVYRHGVQMTLEGSYVDMVNYMSQLESMPVRLIWGNAKLDASNHPRTRLTLTLFTLSLEKDWMKL